MYNVLMLMCAIQRILLMFHANKNEIRFSASAEEKPDKRKFTAFSGRQKCESVRDHFPI